MDRLPASLAIAAAAPAGVALVVSPGISYAITDAQQAYAFVRNPIWQNVNGVQPTAKTACVIGVSGRR